MKKNRSLPLIVLTLAFGMAKLSWADDGFLPMTDYPLELLKQTIDLPTEGQPDVAFAVFADSTCSAALGPADARAAVSSLIAVHQLGPFLGVRAVLRPDGSYRTVYGRIDLICIDQSATTIIAMVRKPVSGRCQWQYEVFGLERLAQGKVWTVRFPPDGQAGGRLFGCFDFLMPGVLTDGGTPWAFVLDFENTGGNMAVISMDGQTVFDGTGRYKLLDEDGDTVMYVLDLEPVSESDLSVMEFSERCGKRVADGPRSATHEALVLRKLSEGQSVVLQSVVYAVEQGAPPVAEETLLSIWESIARNGRGE